MEFVILGLLIIKAQTLYELNKQFAQSVSLFYSASFGSLQAAIKRLLVNEYVDFEEALENGRNKKTYHVTEKGEKAFYEWMSAEINDNKLEVASISRVFLLGLIKSKSEKIKILNEIIEKNQAVLSQLMEFKNHVSKMKISEEFRETSYYKIKTLDYGIKSYKFTIDWVTELLNETEAM